MVLEMAQKWIQKDKKTYETGKNRKRFIFPPSFKRKLRFSSKNW